MKPLIHAWKIKRLALLSHIFQHCPSVVHTCFSVHLVKALMLLVLKAKHTVSFHITRFELDDPFFKGIIDLMHELNTKLGSGILADAFPILRYLPTEGIRMIHKFNKYLGGYLERALQEHRETYDPSMASNTEHHFTTIFHANLMKIMCLKHTTLWITSPYIVDV